MHIYLTREGKDYIKNNIIPIIEVENNVMESVLDKEFESLTNTYSKYIKIFKEEVKKFS